MLYFVPTPVGNLEDITLRTLRILKTADLIIAEDPRMTAKLLNLLEIENKPKYLQITHNQVFNSAKIRGVLEDLQTNPEKEILVVSDAGMPGISDPGFEIIKIAQELDLSYTVLPGANSLLPAVVASGLVAKEFLFLGFLPIKKGRNKKWREISDSEIPLVLFESVHRIKKFIIEAGAFLEAERKICICKDLTKMHEKILILKVSELENLEIVEKGEFVVVVSGKPKSQD